MDISNLRKEYTREGLRSEQLDSDPFKQFELWFQEACAANQPEPNAMSLATTSADSAPSQRIVLLKYFEGRPNRLHDRFLYSRLERESGWDIQRLSP